MRPEISVPKLVLPTVSLIFAWLGWLSGVWRCVLRRVMDETNFVENVGANVAANPRSYAIFQNKITF